MRILLIGEYSNVHWTLAEGLRELGHEVTVVSNGDFWKDYPRDISLTRRPGKMGGISYLLKVYRLLPRLTGYDVVQLINPMFLEMKAERIFPIYERLRKQNRKVFLGAFGMDYYWVHENLTRKPLRYSDFNIGDKIREDKDALVQRRDWLGTAKEHLNRTIAMQCDGIIAGLYEYYVCYQPQYPRKTTFIPFPIKPDEHPQLDSHHRLQVFVGIDRKRAAYKGTDIMLRAAETVRRQHPDKMDLREAVDVPFTEYRKMMLGSDVLLDQLYSYTPAMNALEAMSHGIVVVGGGEPENYEILGEQALRPIVNVKPSYESVCEQLTKLVEHPELVDKLKHESITYIRRHHDYRKVARQYEEFYGLEEDLHL